MASAKTSCFETASNSVMEDRNFMSSGDPRISPIVFSLAPMTRCVQSIRRRPSRSWSEIGNGPSARTDCEPLRHGAEAKTGDLRKDEPYPVAPLATTRQFLDHLRVDRGLCLPQIKPEHIGDAVHPESEGTESVPLSRQHVISARPCSTTSECARHYCSPCRTAAHGADGVRRRPRYDRGIPCGSSRSTVLRMRFARVNAETSGGLERRSIERGG